MTKYIAKIDDEIFCDEDKYERDIEDNVIGCDEDCEECVKQYFEREAEEVQSMTKEIQNILKKDLKNYVGSCYMSNHNALIFYYAILLRTFSYMECPEKINII